CRARPQGRSGESLHQYEGRVARGQRRSPAPWSGCGCTRSLYPGSWTWSHLQSAVPIGGETRWIGTGVSIVRKEERDIEKGSSSYTEVWGVCRSRPYVPARKG